MAKKIGKLLLFSAAIGSAIGAVCYFARKRNAEHDSAEEVEGKGVRAERPRETGLWERGAQKNTGCNGKGFRRSCALDALGEM